MSPPRFTREIATPEGDKLSVKILPDQNKLVVLEDPALTYTHSLDPATAHRLGHALQQAARLAALNVVSELPPSALAQPVSR